MQQALIDVVDSFGYLGVGFLIFIENLFPPIPSEAVLLFGGFMSVQTEMNLVILIIAATCGSLLGAIALYLVGSLLGRQRLKALLSGRLGRVIRLKPESIDRADEKFSRHGKKAVLICRCIPIVRSLISIPAGMSGMRFIPFLALTALGSAVWNTVLIILGAATGNAWERCIGYFGVYTAIAAGALVAAAIIVLVIRKRKSKES